MGRGKVCGLDSLWFFSCVETEFASFEAMSWVFGNLSRCLVLENYKKWQRSKKKVWKCCSTTLFLLGLWSFRYLLVLLLPLIWFCMRDHIGDWFKLLYDFQVTWRGCFLLSYPFPPPTPENDMWLLISLTNGLEKEFCMAKVVCL